MSEELTKEAQAGLPAQQYSGELDAGDIVTPRLKLGQKGTNAVDTGKVPFGAVFAQFGSDDPEPIIVAQPDEAVRLYVLAVYKTDSWNDPVTEDLQTGPPGSCPKSLRDNPDAKYSLTYNYVLAVPAVAEDLPTRLLLNKTSTGAARILNLGVLRAQQDGVDPATIPFELSTRQVEVTKGRQTYRYVVAEVRKAEVAAKDAEKDQAIVEGLKPYVASLLPRASEAEVETTTPAATDAPAIS